MLRGGSGGEVEVGVGRRACWVEWGWGRRVAEVGEDGPDDRRVVDEGDDPATAATGALEHLGAEGVAHQLRPEETPA